MSPIDGRAGREYWSKLKYRCPLECNRHLPSLRAMAASPSGVALSSQLRSVLLEAAATGHCNLSHTGLASVPPQVFGIPNLRRLDLSGNELRHLPDRIGELTS